MWTVLSPDRVNRVILSRLSRFPSRSWDKLTLLCWRAVKQPTNRPTNQPTGLTLPKPCMRCHCLKARSPLARCGTWCHRMFFASSPGRRAWSVYVQHEDNASQRVRSNLDMLSTGVLLDARTRNTRSGDEDLILLPRSKAAVLMICESRIWEVYSQTAVAKFYILLRAPSIAEYCLSERAPVASPR